MKRVDQVNDIRLINYCHKCGYDRWNGQDFITFSGEIDCIACGNILEMSKGRVVLPDDQCIAKEKRFLQEAIEKEDFKALENHAMNIISIKPHDLMANFYEKLAEKKLCSDSYSKSYGDFLCLPPDGTDDDYSGILELALKYYNPREEYQICAFISKLKNPDLQKKWRDEFRVNEFVNLEKTKDETGNTPGNIMNCGYVALKDGWLYYGNPSDGYKLYKSKIDNDGKFHETEKLCDDICRFINVSGDFVYYINISDGLLYRIGIDGNKESRKNLSDNILHFVNVVGSWIYFSNEYYEDRLYKISVNGGEAIPLDNDTNDKCRYINVDGDWIYYSSTEDGGKLCKIHKDNAKGRVTLSNDDCVCINVAGENIYYINASDNYRIYKIRKDGTAKKKLRGTENDICRTINVVGDWIYYTADMAKCNLYKIHTDGAVISKKRVVDTSENDKCWYINIAGNWVYYRNRSDGNKLYRIKIDGKNREEVIINE